MSDRILIFAHEDPHTRAAFYARSLRVTGNSSSTFRRPPASPSGSDPSAPTRRGFHHDYRAREGQA
ncbi:hypothetical protein A7982_12098 [Minicystis rosea]|nr:hypothetical protein A7982_12098 [Minicystis rosea]